MWLIKSVALGVLVALQMASPTLAQPIIDANKPELEKVHYALTQAILRNITERKTKTGDDKKLSAWIDELGTYYAGVSGEAVWVDQNGYNTQAKKIIAEFRNADKWGLSANVYRVPEYEPDNLDTKRLADLEVRFALITLKYADHAQGGRFDPNQLSLWFEQTPKRVDALDILPKLVAATDPAEVMQGLHPQHPGFELLRKAYNGELDPKKPAAPKKPKVEQVYIPDGPRLRPGKSHPHIALVRKRLNVPASNDREDYYDKKLARAVNKFMRTQGWKRKRTIDHRVRYALNNPKGKTKSKRSGPVSRSQILVNMEKWRWIPRDLGKFHIWNNVPEFRTRLVKNDTVIHSERIIVGKTSLQTPIFSDEMTHVIFKPEWGVPNSIKIKSLLPRLRGGDYSVLARRGMRIDIDGRIKHPSRYNWAKTDIRSVPIIMGAGRSNPLGRLKFMFPNQHAVYMHDTPDKHLFNSKTRTFSSGCIRVRNPQSLANIILGELEGWGEKEVASLLHRSAEDNFKVDLPTTIPVHNVYFTVIQDPNTGRLKTHKDIYGHDKRIRQALNGKSIKVIARSDPALAHKRKIEQLARAMPKSYYGFNDTFGAQPGYSPQPFWQQWPKPKYKKKKYKAKKGPPSWAFQLNPYQTNPY